MKWKIRGQKYDRKSFPFVRGDRYFGLDLPMSGTNRETSSWKNRYVCKMKIKIRIVSGTEVLGKFSHRSLWKGPVCFRDGMINGTLRSPAGNLITLFLTVVPHHLRSQYHREMSSNNCEEPHLFYYSLDWSKNNITI